MLVVLNSDSNARWMGQTEHLYNPRSISMTNTSQHQIINMRYVSPPLSTDYIPLMQDRAFICRLGARHKVLITTNLTTNRTINSLQHLYDPSISISNLLSRSSTQCHHQEFRDCKLRELWSFQTMKPFRRLAGSPYLYNIRPLLQPDFLCSFC